MKYWIIALVVAGCSYLALTRWIIPSLIFHPTKEVAATPARIGLEYEEVRLQTEDGETLSAWHIPAAPDADGPGQGTGQGPGQGLTLLFFHGNAGNISHRLESIAFFHRLGFSVFILDYRGFGHSSGTPSVSGTVRDARAAWEWLTGQHGVPPSRIILFGRSLGGGVAAALAAKVEPKALILESTFTSLLDAGKDVFPWLPGWLLLEDYATADAIATLRVPLLVAHSPEDEVINFRMGRALFERYTGPKSFLRMRGSHNGGWFSDLTAYEAGIRDFIAQQAGTACAAPAFKKQ